MFLGFSGRQMKCGGRSSCYDKIYRRDGTVLLLFEYPKATELELGGKDCSTLGQALACHPMRMMSMRQTTGGWPFPITAVGLRSRARRFPWNDYFRIGWQGQLTLTVTEFLRRLFLRVPPKRLVRIRLRFLANRFPACAWR